MNAAAAHLRAGDRPGLVAGAVSDGADFDGTFYWPEKIEEMSRYWVVALRDRRETRVTAFDGEKRAYIFVPKKTGDPIGPVFI